MCNSSTPRRTIISGPSGSISRSPISSTCRTKSSRAWLTRSNAQLVAAEARRAEQAPNPDSMDLYFQGLAWLHKGPTPRPFGAGRAISSIARSRLAPNNVDALVGSASTHTLEAALSLAAEPVAAFAAAEGEIDQRVVRGAKPCARPNVRLDLSRFRPGGSPQGIARCERALALDPKSRRTPMPSSDMARCLSAAPTKRSSYSRGPAPQSREIRGLTLG